MPFLNLVVCTDYSGENTAARREARLNPIVRQEEQLKDTAVRREACLDPSTRLISFLYAVPRVTAL